MCDLEISIRHWGLGVFQVAKESVLRFCPSANITAYHDSIMKWVQLRFCQDEGFSYEDFIVFQATVVTISNTNSLAKKFDLQCCCLCSLQPRLQCGVLQEFPACHERFGQQRYGLFSGSWHKWMNSSLIPSKMCLFCCPCSGQESRQQNVFGCRHSPHWERHGWLSGTSHSYQEGKDLLLNQLFFWHILILIISMSCSWHSRQFSKCRVRQNATSASLNLHRKPSQGAPFATRPLNPFTALCGPNISSSKFTTITFVLSHLKMSTKLMLFLV